MYKKKKKEERQNLFLIHTIQIFKNYEYVLCTSILSNLFFCFVMWFNQCNVLYICVIGANNVTFFCHVKKIFTKNSCHQLIQQVSGELHIQIPCKDFFTSIFN